MPNLQTLSATSKPPTPFRSRLASFSPLGFAKPLWPSPSRSLSISCLSLLPKSIHPICSASSNQDCFAETDKSGHMDSLVQVAHSVADVAGEVLRKYFRQRFDIIDKPDLSPVTIADREAEESMVSLILHNFPSHAIYGEENGWRSKDESADYVWVLDPIDGTKSFINGKPLFGTLISILHKGKPIIGIIDQPILRERWVGIDGKTTTLNGKEISTRTCSALSQAYLYTTSPHLFTSEAEEAFIRVRNKVKVPLYGCDCYAYALLASGFVDLVVESGLKPYDILALVPVIEGAGGTITDWKENRLNWLASPQSNPTSKPLFGTLISILHKGKPIIGIIDQPILRERWVGIDGKTTTLNGKEISTRTCSALSQAYLYTTSPHLFTSEAEEAFIRVRNKVKVPLYGCDCYAYALLASGFVDLVVESGLKPYDILALVPVIEGAGGTITDWKGNRLNWLASPQSNPTSYNVVAAGDAKVHKEAIETLQWS